MTIGFMVFLFNLFVLAGLDPATQRTRVRAAKEPFFTWVASSRASAYFEPPVQPSMQEPVHPSMQEPVQPSMQEPVQP
jgi:hypothetical protein